jgi:hypothetical protein
MSGSRCATELGTPRSRSFLQTNDVSRLVAGAKVHWVMLQYGWSREEQDQIERTTGVTFLVHPDLNLREDLEGLAALGLACGLVLSARVSTREVSAAAG